MSEPIEVETTVSEEPQMNSRPSSSERNQKITKPKSPGRVAAGKKLAEMNRKNKAKKNKEEPSPVSEDWNIDPGYVIGAIGIILAAGSLYLQWKERNKPAPRTILQAPPSTPPTVTPVVTPPKSRIPEME